MNRSISPCFLFFTLIFCSLTGDLSAQVRSRSGLGGSGEIRGYLRLDSGAAAPNGVLIILFNRTVGGEQGRTITDSSGRFSFERIPAEEYEITAKFPGYQDAEERIDLRFVPRGTVRFTLIPERDKNPPAIPPGGPADTISAKQPASEEARRELERGQILLVQKGDARGSIEHFEKLTQLEPEYPQGYLLLGAAQMSLQNWGEAFNAFEAASRRDGDSAQAFLGLGICRSREGKYTEAEKYLSQSLQINDKSAEAHYEIAAVYWATGNLSDAGVHADKAITFDAKLAPAHLLKGNVLLRQRDAKGALSEYNEYLRLDPSGPFSAATRQMVGKIEQAISSAPRQK